MSSADHALLEGVYHRAAKAEELPWHTVEMPRYVGEVAAQRPAARVLDVGCGAGTHGVQMARLGWEVTGVDLVARALEFARQAAHAAGVRIDLVQENVLQYRAPRPFTVVYDSGCLHNLGWHQLPAYRGQLLDWLEHGGDYVLAHWDKKHCFDWRPNGPRRRSLGELESLFGKTLRLVKRETFELYGQRDGSRVRASNYWFKRA